jgi:hypothetical protein
VLRIEPFVTLAFIPDRSSPNQDDICPTKRRSSVLSRFKRLLGPCLSTALTAGFFRYVILGQSLLGACLFACLCATVVVVVDYLLESRQRWRECDIANVARRVGFVHSPLAEGIRHDCPEQERMPLFQNRSSGTNRMVGWRDEQRTEIFDYTNQALGVRNRGVGEGGPMSGDGNRGAGRKWEKETAAGISQTADRMRSYPYPCAPRSVVTSILAAKRDAIHPATRLRLRRWTSRPMAWMTTRPSRPPAQYVCRTSSQT